MSKITLNPDLEKTLLTKAEELLNEGKTIGVLGGNGPFKGLDVLIDQKPQTFTLFTEFPAGHKYAMKKVYLGALEN